MNTPAPADAHAAPATMSLKDFLEKTPVLECREVAVECEVGNGNTLPMAVPAIELYCGSPRCGGVRLFDPTTKTIYIRRDDSTANDQEFVTYLCRNCHEFGKQYALNVLIADVRKRNMAVICKVGESPAFGEPRPQVITDVLDDEIKYFERGYRAETSGLGIGAFAYYRRFVDSHKDKLIAKIREVAVAQGADAEVLKALDRAKVTNSFERAVEEVKDAIPPGLRLNGGHNPLTLLYEALSVGIHADDDPECLERAHDIRTVLAALAEKMQNALAATRELDSAVKRLMDKRSRAAR